jgi:adenylate cyclase
MQIRESKLVLVSVDLAGYARATASLDALTIAQFLDAWYGACAAALKPRGGRIIKFMGDGCLAVFPGDRAVDAIDAVEELARGSHTLPVKLGANVHLAIVAEGDVGPDGDRRYDVLGSGVNHLFLMGGAAGFRISEPVFRQLPNDRRAEWSKQRPPATYARSF